MTEILCKKKMSTIIDADSHGKNMDPNSKKNKLCLMHQSMIFQAGYNIFIH